MAFPELAPLDPMPDAPPEMAAAWVERIAKGVFLWLWLLLFISSWLLLRLWGFIPSWVSYTLISPVFLATEIITAWLITSPDPGDARWSLCLRWGVRVGALQLVIVHLILLVPVLGLKVTPQVTACLAVGYCVLRYVHMACSVACYWYFSRLGRRLGDPVLRIGFGVVKWVYGVVFVVGTLAALVLWDSALKTSIELLQKAWNWQPLAPTSASVCFWVGFLLVFGGYFVALHWRLWRRLRTAAKALKSRRGGKGG